MPLIKSCGFLGFFPKSATEDDINTIEDLSNFSHNCGVMGFFKKPATMSDIPDSFAVTCGNENHIGFVKGGNCATFHSAVMDGNIGHDCPTSSTCLLNNIPFSDPKEAYVACAKSNECASIMQYNQGGNQDSSGIKYYMRRESDPVCNRAHECTGSLQPPSI
jgi:hypothetical protein